MNSGNAVRNPMLAFRALRVHITVNVFHTFKIRGCLLYTSDAADDLLCVDLGGRRLIKKKKQTTIHSVDLQQQSTL